jgi:O-antigen/teichoic acid export membrane protein
MLVRSVMSCLQASLRFGAYALLDAAQATVRIILVVAAGWAGIKLAGAYVAAYGLGAAAVLAPGLVLVGRSFSLGRLADAHDRRGALRYAAATSVVVALGTVTGRSDLLILEGRIGAEPAALYAAALHIASVLSLLGGYVSVVSQPRVLAWARAGMLGRLVAMNLGVGTILGVAAIGFTALVPGLVGWLFGGAFSSAAPLVTILVIGTSLDLLIMPLLLPYALQWFPRYALVAEACLTAAFLAIAFGSPGLDPASMAWLATGIRAGKLGAYLGVFLVGARSLQTRISR